jgi:hypothetical protein
MALPDRLPAHPEHRRDHRPTHTAASEPVDLVVDELLHPTRLGGQLGQAQRPRISNRRTERGLFAVLADPAALTTTHADNDHDNRPHRRPHERPGDVAGDIRGDAAVVVRAARHHHERQA